MIISHKYKFIFIKTKKVAGTSVEIFLSQQCGDKDISTPINPYVEPHIARNYLGIWNPIPDIFCNLNNWKKIRKTIKLLKKRKKFNSHIPAIVLRRRIPKKTWETYYKFSIERNPWDKTLSAYYHFSFKKKMGLSFEDYLERGKFCLNYPLYTDPYGNIMVDRIIKYEKLIHELGQVCNKLGIPFSGSLGINAKSEYRENKVPYQEFYTNSQRMVIERAFAKEIELHGYSF